MAYNFTAEWIKGTLNNALDALSWNPVSDPLPQEMLAEYDTNNNPASTIAEIRAVANHGQESVRIQELQKQAKVDHTYQQLQSFILKGFPEQRSQLPEECR